MQISLVQKLKAKLKQKMNRIKQYIAAYGYIQNIRDSNRKVEKPQKQKRKRAQHLTKMTTTTQPTR